METEPPLPPRHLAERMRRALERISLRGEADSAIPVAEALFQEVYAGAPEAVATSSTFVPLIAEHTHYFSGFGLLMRMPGGVAVAAGPSPRGLQIVVSGADEELVKALVDRLYAKRVASDYGGLDLTVVCATAAGGAEAVLAAVGVALLRSVGYSDDPEDVAPLVSGAIAEVIGRPYGPANVLAALDESSVVLIDAGTSEHVGMGRPEALGAAVLELGVQRLPPPEAFQNWQQTLASSLERLRSHGYADLTSLRHLEHQDLPRALALLDSRARPFIRHLVTEDRRVPRLVAAIRREDPQVLGALLLMSHASRRDDARASIEEVEYVLGLAESTEGIYGARMAGPGYGGRVVFIGRPFLLPDIVDRIAEAFQSRFGTEPDVSLL